MRWLSEISAAQPAIWAVLVLMLVGMVGLAFSTVRIRGISVGVVGVLFAGIIAGHFGLHIETSILEFVREFGLALFVFTIGLQLGPGFFDSFRKQGIRLNAMALAILLLGVFLTLIATLVVNKFVAIGLLTGATTNTPSLGAAQQMIKSMGRELGDQVALPAIAYAVTYPGGVVGIIAVLLVLRKVFNIRPEEEAERFLHEQGNHSEPLERMHLLVQNQRILNRPLQEILSAESGVVISRIRRADTANVEAATTQSLVQEGDIVLAVGTRKALERLREIVGPETDADLTHAPGQVISARMVVTEPEVFGRTIGSLRLGPLFGGVVTRVARADVEMVPAPELRLRFGDVLQVVAHQVHMKEIGDLLGNRLHVLHETNFLPVFIGMLIGVLVGMIPIPIPGIPIPVRVGIAGGPLIVAIILSRIGKVGPIVWYMPPDANAAFRQLGITLFLACVGLKAGDTFFSSALTRDGLLWMLCGFGITVIPLFVMGVVARAVLKWNFTSIAGLLAGSMTDPPALAFANSICKSDAPSVAYATVYPLTMLLRVVSVQILAVIFFS